MGIFSKRMNDRKITLLELVSAGLVASVLSTTALAQANPNNSAQNPYAGCCNISPNNPSIIPMRL